MTSANSKPGELPSFRLDGRLAIITGAGDGIGRTFAAAFARSGAEVVLVSRTREKLLEAQREIESAGGRAHTHPADVSKIADLRLLESGPRGRFFAPVDSGPRAGPPSLFGGLG